MNEPIVVYQGHVLSDWIDYNGHMNIAYYVLAFDRATDGLLDHIGLDETRRASLQSSVFTLELQVNYLRELLAGEPIRISAQLLDVDAKRIHYFLRLFHAAEGHLAATCEQMLLYVDMRSRRSAVMPQELQHSLAQTLSEHRELEWPAQAGRGMGIRRKATP